MKNTTLKQTLDTYKKYPRKYISEEFNPKSWEDIEKVSQELSSRTIENKNQLEKWITDWSEFQSVIRQEESYLYINMTCFTNDKQKADDFSYYIENIEPKLAPYEQELKLKLVASPFLNELDSYYDIFIKNIKNDIELFREENIKINKEIALELQNYQQVTGSMSVEYKGETKTMPQMSSYLEENDRTVREEAWHLISKRRLEDKEKLNKHFDKLLKMRIQTAKNCGYDNFLDYIFQAKERYDYTAKDCQTFHNSIEKLVVPIARKITAKRKKDMNLKSVKPWDTATDPLNRPPLKPATNSDELCEKTYKVFSKLDSQLAEQFNTMRKLNLLDLDSRIGKAPGGYQCSLDLARLPFIFMNSTGTNGDLLTLLHESGHSFHQFAMEKHELNAYRDIPAEFAEVASMSMELMASDLLDEFYTPEEKKRSFTEQLEDVFSLLCWIAIVDAFQHWMYSNPNHNQEERKNCWIDLNKRFGTGVDWDGLEEELAFSWHRQLHIFEVPFYYVEYGIAQLGALQLWANFKKDPSSTLVQYKAGLSLGNSKPLPELFKAAGIKFDFSEDTLFPLMEMVKKELDI